MFKGDQAHNAVVKHQPDLVILDIALIGVNVFNLCHSIRESFDGPLLVLTTRDNEQDQITALGLGVDGYLTRTVSFNLLKARVEAIARRSPKHNTSQPPQKVEVGDIALYPQAKTCKVNGQSIKLSGFEFQLLLLLLSNVGKVLTRDQIYSLIWDANITEWNVLLMFVFQLCATNSQVKVWKKLKSKQFGVKDIP